MSPKYALTPLVEALTLAPGASVARVLNVSGQRLASFAEYGIEERTAERLAVRAGFHPSVIWTEWFDDAIAELERECEAPDCPVRFVLKWRGAHRRFCSDTCRDRTGSRRRYAERPELRERKRAKVRQYEAEVREARMRRAS